MLIAWQLIKLGASNILAFIIKHWRVIVPLLVLWYCYAQYTAEVKRADTAELALITYKADIAELNEKRERENEIKRIRAEADVKALILQHTNEIEGVKNGYEKIIKTLGITITNLRSELRNKISSDIVSMPDYSSDASTDSEVWRERYTTLAGQYETLKMGCTVTTSDFNACRAWGDVVCSQNVCK